MIVPEFVNCPECDNIAVITDRYVMPSTHGPVEHVAVVCVMKHRFVMLDEDVKDHETAT
jgi:hypothetical protein